MTPATRPFGGEDPVPRTALSVRPGVEVRVLAPGESTTLGRLTR